MSSFQESKTGHATQPTVKPPDYLPGYAEYSAYIAVDPDLQIYRRFDKLIARNLLYLQSEMLALEKWFEEYDRDMLKLGTTGDDQQMQRIVSLNQDWQRYVEIAEGGVTGGYPSDQMMREAVKMDKIKRLREVTKEYRECPASRP